MGHQNAEQEKLRRRWEQTAQTIQALRMKERKEIAEQIMQAALSSILTLVFVIGISVWFAQRIMAH